MGLDPVQDTSTRFLPLDDCRIFAARSNQLPTILLDHRNLLGCDARSAGPMPREVEMSPVPKAFRRKDEEMALPARAVRKLRAAEVLGLPCCCDG